VLDCSSPLGPHTAAAASGHEQEQPPRVAREGHALTSHPRPVCCPCCACACPSDPLPPLSPWGVFVFVTPPASSPAPPTLSDPRPFPDSRAPRATRGIPGSPKHAHRPPNGTTTRELFFPPLVPVFLLLAPLWRRRGGVKVHQCPELVSSFVGKEALLDHRSIGGLFSVRFFWGSAIGS
jgi:hypothetical protein